MATLSLVESVDAFVAAIEKSGLLSADEMQKVREAAAKADKAKSVARLLVKDGTLTSWQANQLLYGYHKLIVGKYKLLEQLGAGEMGRVYLAEHAQMGRRHCLKVLSRRHISKPQVLKRFLDEAERVCALEHRNLSHVYDVNQGGDQYYIVMEYVEGQNLQSAVEKAGKLPIAEAIDYVRQTAEGLAHAHEHGVVHGDLKPSNLVLDGSRTVKILDIGQARLAEGPAATSEKDETTETASLAAAIHHAPEQRGSTPTIDQRSDIYSLGSVLCYLLTGTAAPDADAAEKQLLQVSKLPVSLLTLCKNMMADQLEARTASMQAVLTELTAIERERSLPPMPGAKPDSHHPANGKGSAKNGEPPAKSKKPPVAKALNESSALPIAKSIEPAEVKPDDAPVEDPSPFAGFAVQSRPGGAKNKKPPIKPAADGAPAIAASAGDSAAAGPAKKSYLPLILGGSIGGGVLAIAGICLIVYFAFFRGAKPTEVAAVPKAGTQPAAAQTPAEVTPAEGNPGESNPAAEANPSPTTAPPTKPAEPNAGGSATISGSEKPMAEPVKPAEPTIPAPKPVETPVPAPMPAPSPEPPMPAAKPMPAGNPFEGFATAVSLPKLGNPMSDLPPEALAAKTLGPCKVDEKALVIARLKGGEFAARGGRQKFELAAANAGTALQDWDANLTGPEGSITVAKLSGQGGNLTFQWTPEGVKEANAPFLANCALELSAGAGHHTVALREPIVGPPLAIELDKQGSVKWIVENLPDPKSIHFEITKLEGIPRQKYDPENVMRGTGEDVTVWTGPADDTMPLGLKLTSGISGKNVQITSAPWLKFEGMKRPEKYTKKAMTAGKAGAAQKLNFLTQQLNALGNGKEERTEQQRSLLNQEIETTNKAAAAGEALAGFIEALQGTGKIHFRVYYQADEGAQVDLLTTSNEAAPPEKPQKPEKAAKP